MLIAMLGLPGVGKSTVSQVLAARLHAALISVDPIESGMWASGSGDDQPTGLAAYVVAERVAEDNVMAGNHVIIDATNSVDAARDQWRKLAARANAQLCFVEVTCSDPAAHRKRLEERDRNMPGLEPSWGTVEMRAEDFEPLEEPHLVVDTVAGLDTVVTEVQSHLQSLDPTLEFLG